jgi:hypothetical protein
MPKCWLRFKHCWGQAPVQAPGGMAHSLALAGAARVEASAGPAQVMADQEEVMEGGELRRSLMLSKVDSVGKDVGVDHRAGQQRR